uniref:Uncharacterized protein n=1 Tax=Meloidogyne enterolobii TaxID=390850 RepID=A0A6V7UYU7_MELEN|nr:unnamed protein product [Meloidogyne enterolobii]
MNRLNLIKNSNNFQMALPHILRQHDIAAYLASTYVGLTQIELQLGLEAFQRGSKFFVLLCYFCCFWRFFYVYLSCFIDSVLL